MKDGFQTVGLHRARTRVWRKLSKRKDSGDELDELGEWCAEQIVVEDVTQDRALCAA